MAPPWGGSPSGSLQLLALAALAYQLNAAASPRLGFAFGWLFGLTWLTGTFWWLFISMHTYGGLAAPLAAVSVLALAGALALYHGIAAWAFVRWRPRHPLWAATVFAATWLMAELARGTWLTGFGWGASAYAHTDGLASAAAYVGAYGVGALVAWIASALAAWVRTPWRVPGLVCLGCAGIMVGAMRWAPEVRSSPSGRVEVALLQGNIAQDKKFVPEGGIEDALVWYAAQLRASQASLTVAPETALPVLPQQLPPGYWDALSRGFRDGQRAALIGLPLGNAALGYTNSAVALTPAHPGQRAEANGSPAGAVAPPFDYRYDKHHLVPFGEFIPPLFRWFTELMSIPLGDFNRGAVGQSSFEWQGERFAPNICYEDLFGEELAARFLDPRTAPTVFVNLSNIGWFGKTVAVEQHLQISRMRAIEFARPMIRATNTGPTVIMDHAGVVTHALAPHTRGVLVGTVQGRNGITPFAWWASRFGLWPLWLMAIAVLAIAAFTSPRGPRRVDT